MVKMEMPEKPDEADCCNSGCQPCIFDVYEKQMEKYLKGEKQPFITGENCLKTLKYTKCALKNIIKAATDCNVHIFECNDCSDNCCIQYEAGDHCIVKIAETNSEFTRAYTLIPHDGIKNLKQFAILFKLYSEGKMSSIFAKMQIGCETFWRGPYEAPYKYVKNQKGLLMVAQGTGVAPFYAISRKILENGEFETRIKLFYCCRSLEFLYLRQELYLMLDYWNFQYEVFLSQNFEGRDLKYKEIVHNQKLNEEFLMENCNFGNFDQILLCGSENFMEYYKSVFTNLTNIPVICF